jgi:hypothetical protein
LEAEEALSDLKNSLSEIATLGNALNDVRLWAHPDMLQS